MISCNRSVKILICIKAFYAINSSCLGPNHVNTTASEAELVLQVSTNDRKKYGIGKRMLSKMSSTILSWETVLNLGNKAMVQDQWFNIC